MAIISTLKISKVKTSYFYLNKSVSFTVAIQKNLLCNGIATTFFHHFALGSALTTYLFGVCDEWTVNFHAIQIA